MVKIINTSGKRKRAIARATLRPGTGKVRVNKRPIDAIVPQISKLKIMEPLTLAGDSALEVNIDVTVVGGGYNSQAEAARLAIGKALSQYNKKLENVFLKYDRQLLVADVRRKETRKPNDSKARAKRQKSYR